MQKKAMALAPLLLLLLVSASFAFAAPPEDDESSSSCLPIVFHDKHQQQELVQILSDMGFQSVALRLMGSDLLIGRRGPVTLFAPTDKAFQDHGPLSALRLEHHIVQGVFTYTDLQVMPYATKLLGIRHDAHDLTLDGTHNPNIFVNGVLISHPDLLLYDGLLAVHGVDAFLDALPNP